MGRKILVLVGVLALVAAACSSGTSTESSATGATTATTAAPGSTAATEPAQASGTCTAGQTDGDLVLYNWTEYIDPALIDKFEAEYGVQVIEDFFPSNEELFAKVSSGASGYDVVVPSDYMVSIMIDEGLLMPLQRDAIPNAKNVDPKFTEVPFDPGNVYSMPYQWGTTGIAVNMDVLGEDFPESWALIFDPNIADTYAGQISMLDDPRESLGAALKYLGYSLNTTNEAELAQAADLISQAKKDILLFDSDQFEDLLVAGETNIAHGWNGDFFGAFDDVSDDSYDAYEHYYYFVPEEGGVQWVDNMAILADAPHPCTAHAFINFILDPENGAALTNFNFYASPNAAATEFIDPEILDDPSIYPPPETLANLEFIADTGDFETKYSDYWEQAKS